MNTFIALLRGINVGGHKKLPKAEQLEILEKLGFKNPQVYIHTGNWVFESNENEAALSIKISEAIHKQYDWEVPVIVFLAKQFQSIFDNCPFDEDKRMQSYYTLLASTPSEEKRTELKALQYANEEFYITQRCIYTFYKQGAGKAKLTNNVMERKLKVSATSRNYKTMLKIIALANTIK